MPVWEVSTREEAIRAFLTGGQAKWSGIPPAAAGSIQILKERTEGNRGLAAVRGVSSDGKGLFGIVELLRAPDDEWRAVGGTWGLERSRRSGDREPWANFAGAWGPQGCWAGGRVSGPVHHVRMVDASGEQVVEDTVENGVALLMLDAPCSPCTVELYDSAGALLRVQPHAPPDSR